MSESVGDLFTLGLLEGYQSVPGAEIPPVLREILAEHPKAYLVQAGVGL